jgi:hypothetical protein
MGRTHSEIDVALQAFLEAQRLFFVATAPLAAGGHVNVSPKGLDSFRTLDPKRVAYIDYVGSGAETIAHVKENRRIVLMWCAFDGPPRIVRVHGRGKVVSPQDEEYAGLRPLFPADPPGRAIIVVDVERVADSCGFGLPLFEVIGERSQLQTSAERKGAQGLEDYQARKNAVSIDGLPAVTWLKKSDRSTGSGTC